MWNTTSLVCRQNQDGGWPYNKGGTSCTEATAYSLLALAAAGQTASAAVTKGSEWLARFQHSDGGWAPRPSVDQSTWATALVLLLPTEVAAVKREAALHWLLRKVGRESSWIQRIRSALLDGRIDQTGAGWPWFPDTVAWVTPTCLGLLALEKANRLRHSTDYEVRCRDARQYLRSHVCRDGGWNHGSTAALGYDSDSYPETTGQALLALHSLGYLPGSIIDRARKHFDACQSLEALSWLKLGLMAQGVRFPARPTPKGHGSILEIAIAILANMAANGRNIFLD